MNLPELGKWYKHNKTGKVYRIEYITNQNASIFRKEEYPTTIVYSSDDTHVWSRPIDNWEGKFTLID